MPKPSKAKPKTYPKTQPKKNKFKAQPKPVSITSKKSYWVALTAFIVVVLLAYGVMMEVAAQKIALIAVTLISVIGLACYVRFNTSNLTIKMRATYIFAGATIIGFSVWAATVAVLNATGLGNQVGSVFGDQLFLVTSQVILLVVGGFIGELMGKNNGALRSLFSRSSKTQN